MTFVCWPPTIHGELSGLYAEVGDRLGASPSILEVGGDLAGVADGDAVLVVVDAAVAAGIPLEEVLGGVAAVARDGLSVVFVVGDGYLGTDDRNIAASMGAAASVAAARSIAVRRSGGARANVVCVPARFFGDTGDQRGPLAHEPDVTDVAEAAAFFLGPEAGYLNGQVLFVDGGRHVFSSMTA